MLIMQIMHEASWASLDPCHRPADILRRGAPALAVFASHQRDTPIKVRLTRGEPTAHSPVQSSTKIWGDKNNAHRQRLDTGANLRKLLLGSSCVLSMSAAHAEETSPPRTVSGAVQAALQEVTVTATRFNTTDVSSLTKIPEPVIDTSQKHQGFQ